MKKGILVIVILLLVATLGGGGFYAYRLSTSLEAVGQQLEQMTQRIGDLAQTTIDVAGIYSLADKSVVKIEAQDIMGQRSSGSGFFIDSKGNIATNNHVVETSKKIEVVLYDGSVMKAELVGRDAYSDLAVIKVSGTNLPEPLALADSDTLKVGDAVVAIGSPWGLEGSVTSGIVSQKARLWPLESGYSIPDVIQFDAAINHGNSGGPLLNSKGKVVGVANAIMTGSGSDSFAGVGFAIPSNTASRIIPVLIDKGTYEHPWIGITILHLRPDIVEAMELKISRGVLVEKVLDNGPAKEAGLKGGTLPFDGERNNVIRIGGDVIVRIDDYTLKNDEEFLSLLTRKRPGDKVMLTVVREGNELTLPVTIGVLLGTPTTQASCFAFAAPPPHTFAEATAKVAAGL